MPITISGTTGVAGVAGSAATPALQGTDTNTGIVFPAADTVTIATNGTERMRVDSAGNVGVGTASPSLLFHVSGPSVTTRLESSNNNNVVAIANAGTVGGYIGSNSTTLQFANSAGTAVAAINSTNFQFDSGYGSVVTAYGCRAWVNFNGTGTVAIRASGNVSSITDNNTGDYTVNFTTALPDANYSSVVSLCSAFGFRYALGGQINTIAAGAAEQAPTTSAFRFSCIETAATAFDPKYASVAIFR